MPWDDQNNFKIEGCKYVLCLINNKKNTEIND